MAARLTAGVLAVAGTLALAAPAPAGARVRDVWVAAVPTSWNAVPNGRDAIMNEPVAGADAIFPTVVYRRFTRRWGRALPNAARSSADGLAIPGPLIRARAGDTLLVHFKNMDTLRRQPHSMNFQGVRSLAGSDGTYVPGVSGPGAAVKVGRSRTYRLRTGDDTVGVWPYQDESASKLTSVAGGMFGLLSIRGRRERLPDREFEVVFSPFGKFMAIDGRAFVGNTPVFKARVGDIVQWDVTAVGSDFHTFHVHGHRWVSPGGATRDTQTLGPGASFRVRWREDAPGTWLYHCHVEEHMMNGMIGIYRVTRR